MLHHPQAQPNLWLCWLGLLDYFRIAQHSYLDLRPEHNLFQVDNVVFSCANREREGVSCGTAALAKGLLSHAGDLYFLMTFQGFSVGPVT